MEFCIGWIEENRFIKKLVKIIFYIFIFFHLSSAYSAPILLLDNKTSEISLLNHLDIYRDLSNKVTIRDIFLPQIQNQFKPYNWINRNQRGSPARTTSWLRFTAKNTTPDRMVIVLRGWFNIGDILIYEPDSLGQYNLGSSSQGFVNWSHLLIIDPNQTKTFYVSSYSTRRSTLPFVVYQYKLFDKINTEKFLQLGTFFGITLGLIIFNLFVYFSTRDINYLLYILTWLFFLFFKLTQENIWLRYFWPTISSQEYVVLFNFFLIVSVSFYLAYINSIIKTKIYSPRLYRLSWIIGIVLVVSYFNFIYIGNQNFPSLYLSAHVFYLVSVVACYAIPFFITLIAYFQGYRVARYLLIGASAIMISALIEGTARIINDRYPWILLISLVGNAIEMIFQAFALSDRYNLIKENEEKIKQELIASKDHFIKEQERTIHSYERFLPKQVLPILNKKNFIDVNLSDNVETNFTILFSDIRGFTNLTEKMHPNESFEFINHYLHHVVPFLIEENGIIDKYIGDAIMALFMDVDAAIRGAIKLLEEVEKSEQFHHSIKSGIGIHYGKVILGIIGNLERMECTVISDAVNVASRIESVNKYYETSLLISDVALRKSKNEKQYHKRILDRVRFYGKSEVNIIYEIFGYNDKFLNKKVLLIVDEFEKGLDLYQQKKFLEAKTYFERCLNKYPEDKPSEIYIDRCENLLSSIPKNWDGAFNLDKL